MSEPTPGGRVLVVDDEPLIRRGYAARLREVGHATVEAGGVAEALEIVRGGDVDAVLADIHMGARGGLDLIAELRHPFPDLPVLLMTADPTLESVLAALDLGVFAYLPKPVDTHRLRKVVGRAVAMACLARVRREAQAFVNGPRRTPPADVEAFEAMLEGLHTVGQPIVAWPGGAVVAMEALLRVSDPPGASPGDVLALAERAHQLPRLGRTIRHGIPLAVRGVPEGVRIFVNLHAADLLDDELYDAASPLGRMAQRVTLELTERSAFEAVDNVVARLRRLRALGFRIAIDDLGAGYSGLNSLVMLEPEVVKLDMQLVRGIDRDPRAMQVVRSLCDLARRLDIELIAEGVETAEERDALASAGVKHMQGWHFGRPARWP